MPFVAVDLLLKGAEVEVEEVIIAADHLMKRRSGVDFHDLEDLKDLW